MFYIIINMSQNHRATFKKYFLKSHTKNLQKKQAKLDYSCLDATIKKNRFNFHEVVGEEIKTLLMLLVAVQTLTVEANSYIINSKDFFFFKSDFWDFAVISLLQVYF